MSQLVLPHPQQHRAGHSRDRQHEIKGGGHFLLRYSLASGQVAKCGRCNVPGVLVAIWGTVRTTASGASSPVSRSWMLPSESGSALTSIRSFPVAAHTTGVSLHLSEPHHAPTGNRLPVRSIAVPVQVGRDLPVTALVHLNQRFGLLPLPPTVQIHQGPFELSPFDEDRAVHDPA